MCEGLQEVASFIQPWILSHQESFPPIVVNITDGESTDGDPVGPAANLSMLETNDGPLLLFNCHLSSRKTTPITYPVEPDRLPDEFARKLFEMSSTLPNHMIEEARAAGYDVSTGARGFVFNADMVEVISFLRIGTATKVQ
jgi:hypothetical protein